MLEPTARGMRTGVYMGWDGDRPTRCLDALVHEIDPGVTTTIHRHSWDAILFIVEGSRLDRDRRRALRLEAVGRDPHPGVELAPPRQRRRQARALHELFVGADALDARHERDRGPRPRAVRRSCRRGPRSRAGSQRRRSLRAPPAPPGRGERRSAAAAASTRRYDEQELLATPRGTRTKFLVDRAIGNEASGITQVMIQFAPGKTQSLHRHPGEAWLYVVEGYGHSFMGTAPDKGEHHRWKKGDLIVVDHFLWHQHFNDDPEQPVPARAHPHVRLDPRDDARADGSDGAVRGGRGHAASPCRSSRRSSGRTTSGPTMAVSRDRAAARACSRCTSLPAEHHDSDWDAIIVPREVKERLLAQALLVLQHGRKLSMLAGLPHGLIVLAGPPGTGQDHAGARPRAGGGAGAGTRRARRRCVEINPHAFPSDMLGESQRNITRLLTDTIPEIAARRPHTVVLIDEVESFAVRRIGGVLRDQPGRRAPRDRRGAARHRRDRQEPAVGALRHDDQLHRGGRRGVPVARRPGDGFRPAGRGDDRGRSCSTRSASSRCIGPRRGRCRTTERASTSSPGAVLGWDGRRVRKLVLAALAQRSDVALDPNLLEEQDLLAAVDAG